jgi:hypothetical protein
MAVAGIANKTIITNDGASCGGSDNDGSQDRFDSFMVDEWMMMTDEARMRNEEMMRMERRVFIVMGIESHTDRELRVSDALILLNLLWLMRLQGCGLDD